MPLPNILILSAGRRVELVKGFLNSRDKLIPNSLVFAADINPALSAACRFADQAFQLPRVSDTGYTTALEQLCVANNIGLVIPTIDTELLALTALRDTLSDRGCHVIVSDNDLVATCRDKRTTDSLFTQLSIATPQLYSREKPHFPCFTKLYDGSSSVGAMKIAGAADITAAMHNEPNRIYMELIEPSYQEYTIDLYFDRSSLLKAAIPRLRIEVRAGEVSKGITRRNWVYDYLLQRILTIKGARGCLTLQLFANEESHDVRAIEINPRFGGGYPLSLAAGANFIQWIIREYLLDETIPFFEDWEPNLMMLRYDAHVIVHQHD